MHKLISLFILLFSFFSLNAQELNCLVTVNSDQIGGSNKQVFNTLQQSLNEYINQTKWTNRIVKPEERVNCAMTIIITSRDNNNFTATLQVQSTRPVYNSSYASPILNIKDNEFILSEVKSAVSRLMKRAMEIKVHFMQSLESVKERNIKKDGKYRYDPSLGKDIFIPKISKLRYLTGTQILMIMKAQQKGVLPSRGTFAEMQPYSWLEEMISKKKKKDELERKQLKEKIVYEKEFWLLLENCLVKLICFV